MRKEKENHQSRPLSSNKKYHSFSGEVSYWSSPGHLKACSVSLHDKHSSKRNFLAFWSRKNWRKNKTLIEQGLMGGGGGRGSRGMFTCKPLNFEKPLCREPGLLLGAALYYRLISISNFLICNLFNVKYTVKSKLVNSE